uniref:Uncharacterized protein n=1 Tax=Nelumbo nucifera TaxID=4432 RepID=A0A822YYD2_NELNU|nr:TPA_asm: hypothetical protein HUJ06_007152 [Nelumbo nucifera]
MSKTIQRTEVRGNGRMREEEKEKEWSKTRSQMRGFSSVAADLPLAVAGV